MKTTSTAVNRRLLDDVLYPKAESLSEKPIRHSLWHSVLPFIAAPRCAAFGACSRPSVGGRNQHLGRHPGTMPPFGLSTRPFSTMVLISRFCRKIFFEPSNKKRVKRIQNIPSTSMPQYMLNGASQFRAGRYNFTISHTRTKARPDKNGLAEQEKALELFRALRNHGLWALESGWRGTRWRRLLQQPVVSLSTP